MPAGGVWVTMNKKIVAVFYAFLAAVFYALNAPGSKVLLENVDSSMLAGLLYLGAGVGIGGLSLLRGTKRRETEKLSRADLPYVAGMVLLDIAAPVLLMYGLKYTNASSASLLNNFEIVATTVIAWVIFREAVSWRLWLGVALITLSSILLSCESPAGLTEGLSFSWGALPVLAATVCWGFENNCTRKLSGKDTYEIVFVKGIFSGTGAVILALCTGEHFPAWPYLVAAMGLGFVAYGLSIFFYIRAQAGIGAAKTSAYYAVAPFIGALLSFAFLRETLSAHYLPALLIMLAGSALVVADTLILRHVHSHTHVITHTHDGSTHTHVIEHAHEHTHLGAGHVHHHHHPDAEIHRSANA